MYLFLRRIGLFHATLYLELDNTITDDNTSHILKSSSSVSVNGEFSPQKPWQVEVPCVYDPKLNCFKVDVFIRVGQRFRFVVGGDVGK